MGNDASKLPNTTSNGTDAVVSASSSSSSSVAAKEVCSLPKSFQLFSLFIDPPNSKIILQSPKDSVFEQHTLLLISKLKAQFGIFKWSVLAKDTTRRLQIFVRVPEQGGEEASSTTTTTTTTTSTTQLHFTQLQIVGFAVVQDRKVSIPSQRTCVTSESNSTELLVHEFEIFPQYRGQGYGKLFAASLLLLSSSSSPSSPSSSSSSPSPPLAVWPVNPSEEGLEFARTSIMGPKALASWFVLHYREDTKVEEVTSSVNVVVVVPHEANPEQTHSSTKGEVEETREKEDGKQKQVEGEDAPSSLGSLSSFRFPWVTTDSPAEAIERVYVSMQHAAGKGNWNINTFLKAFSDFCSSSVAPTMTATSTTTTAGSNKSITSSTNGPITGLGFQPEFATAVAILLANDVFNQQQDEEGGCAYNSEDDNNNSSNNNNNNNDVDDEQEEKEDDGDRKTTETVKVESTSMITPAKTDEPPKAKSKDVDDHQDTSRTTTTITSIPPPASSPESAPSSSALSLTTGAYVGLETVHKRKHQQDQHNHNIHEANLHEEEAAAACDNIDESNMHTKRSKL